MAKKVKDTDFMSDLDAATHMQAHWVSNIMLISIATLVVLLVLWTKTSEIEVIARGSGQVVPSSETQIVQSLEGGILKELLVNEGDLVKKGQILMRISDVAFSSEGRGTEAQSISLRIKRARILSEANGKKLYIDEDLQRAAPAIVKNELALYKSRQEELDNVKSILSDKIRTIEAEISENNAEIKRFKESRGLLYQELEITKKMVEQKAVPKMEEIRLRREISDMNGKMESRKERIKGLRSKLKGTQKELADQDYKFRSQALGELNETETKINQLDESLKSIEDRVYRTELRSPVNGIVNKVSLKTIGGVIEPAQKLIEIVPVEDALKIIARVRPNDIAFLNVGQESKVKISAYDPQRYGSLKGKLVRIGANSVTDRDGNVFFEIEVHTEKNYLGTEEKPLPITPGMVAETEVITGKRTIMDYLIKPILRAQDRALTER